MDVSLSDRRLLIRPSLLHCIAVSLPKGAYSVCAALPLGSLLCPMDRFACSVLTPRRSNYHRCTVSLEVRYRPPSFVLLLQYHSGPGCARTGQRTWVTHRRLGLCSQEASADTWATASAGQSVLRKVNNPFQHMGTNGRRQATSERLCTWPRTSGQHQPFQRGSTPLTPDTWPLEKQLPRQVQAHKRFTWGPKEGAGGGWGAT